MRQLRALASLLLLLAPAQAAFSNTQNPSISTLPTVSAYALDRVKVTLPAGFTSPFNVLILFFQRDQESTVDDWLPVVSPQTEPKVQTWLLPVSQRENGLYRWWFNASLRGTQAGHMPRHSIVPLYVDKRSFLGSLKISAESQVVVLLTDQTGRVLWRTEGPATSAKKAELSSFLKKSGG